ncbi:MAG: DUF1990 domain-containing protein [Gemmataceae bacterium]
MAAPPAQRRAGPTLPRRAGALPFTYPDVGASADGSPAGYDLDHTRVRLGEGRATFDAARDALRGWRQFPAPWVRVLPADAPLAAGAAVAVLARAFGVWWLNAARIVFTIAEDSRFGLAYGTLPGHVEQGEERFLVEWLADGSVWYDLRAFSRPRHPRCGSPTRWPAGNSDASSRESLAAMRRLAGGT